MRKTTLDCFPQICNFKVIFCKHWWLRPPTRFELSVNIAFMDKPTIRYVLKYINRFVLTCSIQNRHIQLSLIIT